MGMTYTIEDVKAFKDNTDALISIFENNEITDVDIKDEVIGLIGKSKDLDAVFAFISNHVFDKDILMEYVYQMFKICLYKSKKDKRFKELKDKIKIFYNNEIIYKMDLYHSYRQKRHKKVERKRVCKPRLMTGDCEESLKKLPEQSVQLIFTSPPYYNARAYSNYHSYNEYLDKMKRVFMECHRVI